MTDVRLIELLMSVLNGLKCKSFPKIDLSYLMDGALFLGEESDRPVHLPLYRGSNIKVNL